MLRAKPHSRRVRADEGDCAACHPQPSVCTAKRRFKMTLERKMNRSLMISGIGAKHQARVAVSEAVASETNCGTGPRAGGDLGTGGDKASRVARFVRD